MAMSSNAEGRSVASVVAAVRMVLDELLDDMMKHISLAPR